MEIINSIMRRLQSCRGTLTVHRPGRADKHPLAELWRPVRRLARCLHEWGVQPGDRVGVIGKNCLEWILLDLACIYSGFVSAPLDTADSTSVVELMRRYDVKILFTDVELHLQQGASAVHALSAVRSLAGLDGTQKPPETDRDPVLYGGRDVLTLKFTSGSTGKAKGLGATVGSIDDSISEVDRMFHHGPGDAILVFLPLSLLQQRYWIYSAIVFDHDIVVTSYPYAFSSIKAASPTVVMGVPGFYEALQKFVMDKLARDPGLVTACEQYRAHYRKGCPPGRPFEPVHAMCGGAIRYLWTGSAAAPLEMLRFFTELGLPIYEGYGLNETCIVSKNYPGANKIGSVGKVLPNKEVTFDEHGQILVRSRNPVNVRYAYCEPGENERMFGRDGTVYTGDVGHLDDDGFLYISGRVNDLIVLTSGKNVFPQRIEDAVKATLAVECCMVYGHGKPHLVAVVVPREQAAPRERLDRDLADVNRSLAPHEKIGEIVIATEAFTRENGLLTSQYKMRRKRIADQYKDALEACYTQST